MGTPLQVQPRDLDAAVPGVSLHHPPHLCCRQPTVINLNWAWHERQWGEVNASERLRGESILGGSRTVTPSIVAFPIIFVVVAIASVGHRDRFTVIRRTDRTLVWRNIHYLLSLRLVPLGASLMRATRQTPRLSGCAASCS